MSTASRIASGSSAAWSQVFVALFLQLGLVPIYLSHWDTDLYGVWLAILAAMSLSQVLDAGHHAYMQHEFLRIGSRRPRVLRKALWSAVVYGFLLGGLQLLIVLIVLGTGLVGTLVGAVDIDRSRIGLAPELLLLSHSLVWWISGSVGGLLSRALAPLGHYPRTAWWATAMSFITSIFPGLAVLVFDASLLAAGLTSIASAILVNAFFWTDMWRLLRRERLLPCPVVWRLGLHNLARSQALTVKWFLEVLRQQGVRLLLSPLVGPSAMATFVTVRTLANLALQSLGTLTNPLAPELMRFINVKDQSRMEAAFGLVWLTTIGAIAPGILLLQAFIEPAFLVWTHGKIHFDPTLFAILALGVLVYGVAQPAMAVVQGNNLLRVQLLLSGLAGLVAIGGMVMLVPDIGIRGAAFALLAAELVSALAFLVSAASWLKNRDMVWPWVPFYRVCFSIIIFTGAFSALAWLPNSSIPIVVAALSLNFAVLVWFWRSLPALARDKAKTILVPSSLQAHLRGHE